MNKKLQELANDILDKPYESSGHIYHPLPFPEFDGLKVSSKSQSAYYQWKLIERSLEPIEPLENNSVLDVGANAGFYSFNFAKQGAFVDAFEPHEFYTNLGQKIVEATDLPVRWHNQGLEQDDLAGKRYDISLMLSVFQWISEGNKHLESATALLHDIAGASRYLFFGLGCNQGKSAVHTEERPILWIWELLKKTTTPKRVYYLGSHKPWKGNRRFLFVCSQDPINLGLWQKFVTAILQLISRRQRL